jgi:hypothetical protein
MLYAVAADRPTVATAFGPTSNAVPASGPPPGNGLKLSAKVSNINRSQPPSSTVLWYTAFQPADETNPRKKASSNIKREVYLCSVPADARHAVEKMEQLIENAKAESEKASEIIGPNRTQVWEEAELASSLIQ